MKRKQLTLAVAAALAAASTGGVAQEVASPEIEEVFVLGEFVPDESATPPKFPMWWV